MAPPTTRPWSSSACRRSRKRAPKPTTAAAPGPIRAHDGSIRPGDQAWHPTTRVGHRRPACRPRSPPRCSAARRSGGRHGTGMGAAHRDAWQLPTVNSGQARNTRTCPRYRASTKAIPARRHIDHARPVQSPGEESVEGVEELCRIARPGRGVGARDGPGVEHGHVRHVHHGDLYGCVRERTPSPTYLSPRHRSRGCFVGLYQFSCTMHE